MREAGGDARRVAGLLQASGSDERRRELALSRMARVAAQACAGKDAAATSHACALLREQVFERCEHGRLDPADARLLCRQIDAAESAALEEASASMRSLEALDRACTETNTDLLPRIALEGAPSADSAALLVAAGGTLSLRVATGLLNTEAIAAAGSAAARAAAQGAAVEASGEDARAVLAFPLLDRRRLWGVLRVASRTAARFGRGEKRFLRALASRSTALLSAERTRESEEQEARLRQALQTFESLIETSPLPIVSLDCEGKVRTWNRAAEELFGWTRAEVVGRPPPYVPEEKEEESQKLVADCREQGVLQGREVRRLRKDGSLVDLSLSLASLRDAAGKPVGSIAILADISERKQREAEEEARERFREHFIGIVGHDLRNPLTAIITSAQLLLLYSALNERQSRVVHRVAASAERMARMIDDLLDFARSRLGGGFPIHPRRVDLRELVEHTIEELEFAHATRTVHFRAEGDLWGTWDADRIAQVVSNLVGNALQHSPDGSPVEVTLVDRGEDVVLETLNGGPPIPAEVLPHIFEPGRRSAGSGGLGLGLFIAQQIVLAHGGSISATSSPEEGTRVSMTLPRRARQKAP
ncbi:MAG: PAS domain S-box protein [Deltaproteobacteria bacterium]|nr:MAG: PAS domain S-box protein [Deltaproteobacteria bacterium]